jgi:hypothetical protein
MKLLEWALALSLSRQGYSRECTRVIAITLAMDDIVIPSFYAKTEYSSYA